LTEAGGFSRFPALSASRLWSSNESSAGLPGVGGYPQGLIIGLTKNALQSLTRQNIRTMQILSARSVGCN